MTLSAVAGHTFSAGIDLRTAVALALFVALLAAEAALLVWAAPSIDPTAPIFTT